MSLRVCGPKLSTFLVLVSVWGLVQLTLMGLALHKRDVQYVEDIDLEVVRVTYNFHQTFIYLSMP